MTPVIRLSGGFILRADSMQWVVAKEKTRQSGDKAGEVYEETMGYFSSLPAALNKVLEFRLREAEVSELGEIRELILSFRKEMGDLLDGN